MSKTPEEIKKGLECCVDDLGLLCLSCTYAKKDFANGLCRESLAGDAFAYIQQLEAQVPRWISVEERLPEKRDWVLVIGEFVPEGGWCVPHIAEYYLDNWRIEDDGYSFLEDRFIKVTHWMPLPEPPKEG